MSIVHLICESATLECNLNITESYYVRLMFGSSPQNL